MTDGRITREEAIEIAGLEIVEKLENSELDPTNRVTNGTDQDGMVEYAATAELVDGGEFEYTDITMYCFVANTDVDTENVEWEESIKDAEFEVC